MISSLVLPLLHLQRLYFQVRLQSEVPGGYLSLCLAAGVGVTVQPLTLTKTEAREVLYLFIQLIHFLLLGSWLLGLP